MMRLRRAVSVFMVLGVLTLPLKGCAGGPPGLPGPGGLASTALKIGASVGSYFLIQELTK